jgi:hypothetical protein
MSQDRSIVAQAAELALFGPLGAVVAVLDRLPTWVEHGGSQVLHQVEVARVVGEHATRHAAKRVNSTLVGLGVLPGPVPPPTRGDPGGGVPAAIESPVRVLPPPPEPTPAVADVAALSDLAIPGYDSLSAFQVVQRLAGLAPGELEDVRAYEAAGRGRRTILSKIAQLQTGHG